MERQYAQALWNAIEGGTEPAKAVHMLHQMLQRAGREVLMPKIAHAFKRLAETQMSKHSLTLSVAREKDAHRALEEARKMSRAALDKESLEVAVDESLIGGWRLEGREHLIDASFKKYLLDVYNAATT